MKNRLTHLIAFYRAGKNIGEASRSARYAQKLQSAPRLSRAEKRDILQAVTGTAHRASLLPKLAFAGVLTVFLIGAVSVLSLSAQPDDGVFYHIRRGVDAVREVVQPGFDPEPSVPTQSDADHTSEDDASDKSGRGSSDRNDDSGSGAERNDDSDSSHQGGSDEPKTDQSHSGSSSRGSDDDGNDDAPDVEGTSTDHNSSRDACRASLDARKKAGEDVDSDDYKVCDSL